jgi:hypothetical protein
MDEHQPDPRIDTALDSLTGIQRVQADLALLQKIEARIEAQQQQRLAQQKQVRQLAIRLAVAAAIMLLLNAGIWFSVSRQWQEAAQLEHVAAFYFGTPANY